MANTSGLNTKKKSAVSTGLSFPGIQPLRQYGTCSHDGLRSTSTSTLSIRTSTDHVLIERRGE